MSSAHHDDMLFEILKECKTLPNFLDAVFGFLHRRSDFYHISKEENAPVGLPEGMAEYFVRQAFQKWKRGPSETIYSNEDISMSETIPCVDNIVEITTEDNTVEITTETEALSMNDDDDLVFTEADSYNGRVCNNYCWSQNITEVDIIVRLPENVTIKDFIVDISSSSISVKLNDGTNLLEGELCQKCKANEAMWSLSGRKLQIHLEKCRLMWWNCLVKTEPLLDVSKIDCSRPFEDLPEDAQAKIEELQWNQERKRLGLPTSDEMALQETLKKSWNVKGSPFSGPFDPSIVKFE